ncbi:helix-turn-helix transcriptional regulator [Ruegeria arenilitoris]|uniref:helix-turn-helix transcriptional regulator n=1 Tax=Ruegeria arenilitoris TaxID=1173585 RepID=UPI00147AC32E|nr:hypothetical protein [Ruegeria arenilitoris]
MHLAPNRYITLDQLSEKLGGRSRSSIYRDLENGSIAALPGGVFDTHPSPDDPDNILIVILHTSSFKASAEETFDFLKLSKTRTGLLNDTPQKAPRLLSHPSESVATSSRSLDGLGTGFRG